MENELMTVLAYTHLFGFLYLVNKSLELGYIQRRTTRTDENDAASRRATELRKEGGLTNIVAAYMLDKNTKIKEETPLSRALEAHWKYLDSSVGRFMVRELTTFPTFNYFYERLRGQTL